MRRVVPTELSDSAWSPPTTDDGMARVGAASSFVMASSSALARLHAACSTRATPAPAASAPCHISRCIATDEASSGPARADARAMCWRGR
eukprot:1515101-Rhodomonas_salina.3